MLSLLWIIPALPFLGYLLLAVFGKPFSKRAIAIVATGSVGLAAILTLVVGVSFLQSELSQGSYVQTLWTWMAVGQFVPAIVFRLDALSLLMMFVVTFVSFLIHL